MGIFNVPYINACYLMKAELADFLSQTFESNSHSPWLAGRLGMYELEKT